MTEAQTAALREAEARIYRIWALVPFGVKASIMGEYPDGYDPVVRAIREAAAALSLAAASEDDARDMLDRIAATVGKQAGEAVDEAVTRYVSLAAAREQELEQARIDIAQWSEQHRKNNTEILETRDKLEEMARRADRYLARAEQTEAREQELRQQLRQSIADYKAESAEHANTIREFAEKDIACRKAESNASALRTALEQEKRLGLTVQLGSADGGFVPVSVVRLAPLEAALGPADPPDTTRTMD